MSIKSYNLRNALTLFASRLPFAEEIKEGRGYTIHMTERDDDSVLELKAELSYSDARLVTESQSHVKDPDKSDAKK